MLEVRSFSRPISELVRGFVALALIAVFSSIAQSMPEVTKQRIGDMEASTLLRFGTALLSILVLALMVSPASATVAHLLTGGRRSGAALSPRTVQAARDLGGGVAGLIVVAVAYSVGVSPLRDLVFNFSTLSWLPAAVAIALLVAALVILVQLYQSVGPLIEGMTGESSQG